ncbi:MAG: hypothetical protein GF417_00885 [Candidatus Latescibacteria bacterium]|nr:hypothetical protein [bacterium]MBD3422981.1 hypothetical protein [Candidatus Latescibacterota bacterium]
MKISNNEKVIGYFGFPSRRILGEARKRYGERLELVDLDVAVGAPDSGLLNTTTCRIIANVIDNAVYLSGRLAAVVADVGESKCDRGRHAAFLLREMGFEVMESRFPRDEFENRDLIYSTGRGPLPDRINAIMDTVVDPTDPGREAVTSCEPTHGFWGVPPNDFRILEVFPETTHIFGWTRCVEAGRPGDLEMECYVEEGLPTVFFAQSFCAKQDLAHHLAGRNNGLYVDCHRSVNHSILSKVEAFIKLS